MIVSISGPVGSGKTTIARRVADALGDTAGHVEIVRFQSLPCFTWLRSSLKAESTRPASTSAGGRAEPRARWQGYERKPLSLANAVVYLARIVAFRFYTLSWSRRDIVVTNRYFYDLFPHYQLDGLAERFYFRVLRAAMPVPAVAILAQANEETLARRRPDYAPEYIAAMASAYGAMRTRFPELRELQTDGGDNSDALDRLLAGVSRTTRPLRQAARE